mmetsp:Transcript_11820/g.18152  ORF Transcript_11820/g.18152 Transcript_11820/m.18152 type:complete len:182 (-) Transcript_11820:1082-1627(-)
MKFQSILFPLAYTLAMLGGTAHGFFQSKNIIGTTQLLSSNTMQYRTRALSPLLLDLSNDDSSGANRQANGMAILPSNVVKYSTVPKDKFFTIDTIPSGLLKEHSTKGGTWGVIRVHQGKLEYTILDPEQSVHLLDAESDNIGIIEPAMLHQTRGLTDDLKFVVEFYRVPGTGVVDEQREGL